MNELCNSLVKLKSDRSDRKELELTHLIENIIYVHQT